MIGYNEQKMKWLLIVFVVTLFYSDSYAKSAPFFNPGIKLGYNFGKYNGFVLGIETSCGVSAWNPIDNSTWSFGGIVIGFSYCFRKVNNKYVYIEAEGGKVALGGGSLGFLYNPDMNYGNPYLRCFAGMVGYLSFRYTIGDLPNEFSIIGKLPLTTNTPVLD